jgi:hypothetical protein
MALFEKWTWALLVAAVACHAPVRPPASLDTASPAVSSADPADAPTHSTAKYEGPPVALTINRNGGAAKATVIVTFPTAGWELKPDGARVKDKFGVAHFTINGPDPGDMVAQMIDEKTWAWESAEPFSRGEVWVRIARRGQEVPKEYRLAAKAP